ncbi:MAG: hypothetical protein JO035_17820 [Betaproteobacteria bacterium]|nr:hypothetical protein [Betaproteobacteria bacterium]
MKTELQALPSDRKFGWTFAAAFAFLSIFKPWWLVAAAAMAAVTLARAELLAPLKRAWMALAELLHRIMSPVAMAIMFFGVFAPMGFVMRLCGWDAMKRAWDPQAKTYWVRRDPPGPADDSFRNLF